MTKQADVLDPKVADPAPPEKPKAVVAKKAAEPTFVTKRLVTLQKPYGGVPSNGKTIPAGTFLEDDAVWLGLTQYLIDTRHAFVTGETTVPVAPALPEESGEDENA